MVPVPALNAKQESGGVAAWAVCGDTRRFCAVRTPPARSMRPRVARAVLLTADLVICLARNDSGLVRCMVLYFPLDVWFSA